MAKNKSIKKKKINTNPPKTTIQELQDSRDGGQIALTGFTYQFLYSCYLILSESDNNTTFQLEGIEDIDHYKCEVTCKTIIHIQLKYSTQKQDASFFKDVLKNFLEAYLLDKTQNFKLVYDFSVAKGNMSKLFNNSLDQTSTLYWKNIVRQLQNENPLWNWTDFCFDDFIAKLTFEKKEKTTLSAEIEKKLIETYDITTNNITLFANGIEMCCLKKMECRESINKQELDVVIQNIKDDISKGVQNPAHSWIKKLKFDISNTDTDFSYFEGKKATPHDIALQLPVRRLELEKEIEESIQKNRVTVIKASSGQGKTTIALQVAYNLQSEYKIYQLLWCNDSRELDNIVQYFKSRVKLGEKPLIIIDNLDSQLGEWNRLAQLLQEEVSYHYKLLLTTREDDWYNYSGDLSNVKALQVVKLTLNEQGAQSIYEVLRKAQKLHHSITDWRKPWSKVAHKKLLIEYVYLLTHGEMIAERIAYQISRINSTSTGRIKCEILRKVCFADICGIKIPVKKLVSSLLETTTCDYGELLKSIENEFLISVNTTEKYVEGLHPVRSQHIVDKLHEFVEINDTVLQVIQISDITYLSKLFSNLPRFVTNKKDFYSEIVDTLWNKDDLSSYMLALRGLFSGSVMQYFIQNQKAFEDANEHGGLILISTEVNPFTRFEEFDYSLQTLDEIKRITPNNANIEYLCCLRDSIPKIVLTETDIYYYCEALFNKLKNHNLTELTNDIPSYASIAYWLLNIEPKFNLANNISLEQVWDNKGKYTLDVISSIMYTCFCGNKKMYSLFVETNLSHILSYLKMATKSLKVFLCENDREIHIEYILLPSDIGKGNEESVSRLKTICKTLPIFDTYCADALKPILDILSRYNIPDDAHKAMPIRNLIIMFHEEFASLWNKTIMSNYECDSILEWLEHWFSIRKHIVILIEKSMACICKLLEGKPLGNLATEFDNFRVEINRKLIREFRYPNQDRPFEEKANVPEGFSKVKSDYFSGIQNFTNQIIGFLRRDSEQSRLVLINLRMSQASLERMHKLFTDIINEQGILKQEHSQLCIDEEQNLQNLIITCQYFIEHQPNKHFNKYQIKNWYNKNFKQMMEDSKAALSSLTEERCITYPKQYYCEGILKLYPIIVGNLDMTDVELLMKFLYHCAPIAELDYDYLVVACMNGHGEIMPNGLKIPNIFLKNLKIAIDTKDSTLIEQISPPFPGEITMHILDCFEQRYEIFTTINTGYEGIDRILELLWAFSKSQKELADESDSGYRKFTESILEIEILDILKSFESQIPHNDFCELSKLCNDVFKGNKFDDAKFNVVYDKLNTKVIEQSTQY
jgi:hypothetical protein